MLIAGAGERLQPAAGPAPAATIKADAWNKLEIIVAGTRIQKVLLNGKDAAPSRGMPVPTRVVISLEGHSVSGQEIRFRNLDLHMVPAKKQ